VQKPAWVLGAKKQIYRRIRGNSKSIARCSWLKERQGKTKRRIDRTGVQCKGHTGKTMLNSAAEAGPEKKKKVTTEYGLGKQGLLRGVKKGENPKGRETRNP